MEPEKIDYITYIFYLNVVIQAQSVGYYMQGYDKCYRQIRQLHYKNLKKLNNDKISTENYQNIWCITFKIKVYICTYVG